MRWNNCFGHEKPRKKLAQMSSGLTNISEKEKQGLSLPNKYYNFFRKKESFMNENPNRV